MGDPEELGDALLLMDLYGPRGILARLDALEAPKNPSVPRDELVAGDLRDEIFREYLFADGTRHLIVSPVTLYTRPGGTTHRVVDAAGYVHCVAFPGPDGSTTLRWRPRNADKPVAF